MGSDDSLSKEALFGVVERALNVIVLLSHDIMSDFVSICLMSHALYAGSRLVPVTIVQNFDFQQASTYNMGLHLNRYELSCLEKWNLSLPQLNTSIRCLFKSIACNFSSHTSEEEQHGQICNIVKKLTHSFPNRDS